MRDGSTGKMPAASEERKSAEQSLALATPEFDDGVCPHDPLAVGFLEINRDVAEGSTPLDHGAVVMRMRDGDCTQSTALGDECAGGVIEQRDAVPQQVSFGRFYQKCALADSEVGLGEDGVQRGFFATDRVVGVLTEIVNRSPLLA